MSLELEQRTGGETEEKRPQKLGFWGNLAYFFLLLQSGALKRDRRRTKGKRSPSKGISGPINHGEDGMPWVWLEAETIKGYDMMSSDQQKSVKADFQEALASLIGREVDIQVQALPMDLQEVDNSLMGGILGEPSSKVAERHAKSRQRSINYIRRYGFKERHVYVGVSLRDERSFLHVALAQLMLWLGLPSLWANGYEHVIYADQIDEIVGRFMDNHILVRTLSGLETAQVIQRCVYRGHTNLPELDDDPEVVSGVGEWQMLSDSVSRDHHRMVEIFHEDGTSSYAIYLSVAKLPQSIDVSWMFLGDMERRPVEVSARLKIRPLEKAVVENSRTLQIVENAISDLVKKGGTSNHQEIARLEAKKGLALAAKDRLENEELPMVEVNAFLIVSDKDPDRCRQNARHVINKSKGRRRKTVLEIDAAYQPEIRRQTYPGARVTYKKHELSLFCDGMAHAMPHATSLIGNGGDLHGVVLGQEACPFRYSHRLVLTKEVDAPSGQVFIGPSGEGKTDAMVNRAISDAEANMAALFDEGKGDTRILEGEHELLVDIMVLDLSSPDMAGLLNPLYLGDDVAESRDLTARVLWKCIGSEGQLGWRPLIVEAIAAEFDEYPNSPDLDRIIKQRLLGADMSDPDRAAKVAIGRTIMSLRNTRFSQVIFGQGRPWETVAHEYIRRGQVTFVVYGHLTPPEADKPDNELNDQERLSLLVRDLTNVIYYKFAMDPRVPLAVYKDEIQIDKRMGGSVASGHLSRIGRSKGSTINLGGQLLEDVPEDFWENASTYNFFRFNTPPSAKKAIELLNLNITPGSAEEKRLLDLLLGTRSSNRRKYDVVVKTYDGEVGLVAFKQIYHGGRFVSNIEGVEELRRADMEKAAARGLLYARRAETPEAAEASLVRLGVSPDIFGEANGYQYALDQWQDILLNLGENELVVCVDGQLKIVNADRPTTAPQLPLSQTREDAVKERFDISGKE